MQTNYYFYINPMHLNPPLTLHLSRLPGGVRRSKGVEREVIFCKDKLIISRLFFRLFILLPGPKTLFLDRYYFHPRVCVCLSVCVSVCIQFISKISLPILMKLGRMMYNDNISVPFADRINRLSKTHTSAI